MPRQKCRIGTAGNNDMCGKNLIYPFPGAWRDGGSTES